MKALSPQKRNQLQQMLAAAQQALRAGHYVQAEGLYLDVLKAAPQAWDVHQALAMLYVNTQRAKEAVKHFSLIVGANPTHAPSHANLAMALSETGNFKQALIEFHRAFALDGSMDGLKIPYAETLRRDNQYEEAIRVYKQVLDVDRVHHGAFNGLGLVYRDMEDLPRALECFEHATGLDSKNAGYRMNFAVCLKQYELIDLAAEQFYEAVKLRPQWLEAIVLLAEVLEEQRRFDEAIECFERALSLTPANPELIERKGYVYMAMGDTGRALNQFNKVIAAHPNRFMAKLGIGRSHMEAGHTEAAVSSLEAYINEFPESSQGYFYLAASRKFKSDDKLIPQIEALIEKNQGDESAAISLNFALGKIYDDCKLWDQAFSHYARGNSLRNKQYDYNYQKEVSRNNRTMQVFTRDFIEKNKSLGTDSEVPVFIVGMPRSGTTLTEQIISSHPQVMGAGEVVFWGRAPDAIPYTLGTISEYPECVTEMSAPKAKGIADKYLELTRKVVGPDTQSLRITDKMPHNFVHLGLIALLFPKARIIHCKRDAMDNCLSIFFQNFGGVHPYAYDLSNLGHHYLEYQRLMAHWHEVLPGRIFDLNYESVISAPEHWSRKLIEYVGLEWDDACLSPHRLERTVKTASHWQVRQPIYKTSVHRWKNYELYLGPLKEVLGFA